MVKVIVDDFVKENYLLKNEYIIIIHGKSTNILTKEVHNVLKDNKQVLEYKLDNNNLGQTIVKIIV